LLFAVVGCARSDDSSKLISAEGFDGVRAGMTVTEVEEEWGALTVLFPADHASGASIAAAPVCDGDLRGVAGFWAFPPVDESDNWKEGELVWLWFLSGVETEEQVRLGSAITDLREAYGDRLKPLPLDTFEFVDHGAPGYMDRLFEVLGESGKTSLLFGLREGRVVAIGHLQAAEQARLFDGLSILDIRC
jgi:hypothetical protein